MANISIRELSQVLEKSGLPFDSGANMQTAGLVGRDAIANTVYGQDTKIPQLQGNYRAQLDKIAQMDQKLAGVYGDPTSKLYIEHAGQRQGAMQAPLQTGYGAASGIQKQIGATQQDLESQIDDALSLYTKLTSYQAKQEAELEKETKAQAKAAKKGTGRGRSTSGVKLTKDQKLAGFKDSDAANYWTKIKEADFKRLWVQNILEGGSIPDEGFSIDDVEENYKFWLEANPPKSKSGTTTRSVF